MANVNEMTKMKMEAIEIATEIGIDIISAKNLVDDGKEVKCSRKLQGVIAKYQVFDTLLAAIFGEVDANVAEKVS